MNKIIAICCYLFLSVEVMAQVQKMRTEVFFSMNGSSTSDCYYANVSGCRLYKITLEIQKNNGIVQSVRVVGDSLKQVLPHDVPAAIPGINADGTKISFSAAGNLRVGTVNFAPEKLYTFDTKTQIYTEITNGRSTGNIKGQWVKWLNDTTLMYSSSNYCPTRGTEPGCGDVNPPTLFSDLRYASGNFASGRITQDYIAFGDINPYTNLISKVCSAQDPDFNPIQKNLVAFHSTASDGYANNGGDKDCPFTLGLSNIFQSNFSDPKPVVFDVTSMISGNQVEGLRQGTHYWLFDLEKAKINSLVHLHWSRDGKIVIGNEQNTVTQPYIECSNNPGVPVARESNCAQKKAITFERVYGFERVENQYRNILRTISGDDSLPLFQPLSPQSLPNSTSFYNPNTDECTKYRTKYVEFCGSNTSIVGTVMCSNEGGNLFSRIMLIDFTNRAKPYYFDITGWVEQHYPTWSPGKAEGLGVTCLLQYDSVLSATSVRGTNTQAIITSFYNTETGVITITAQDNNIEELVICNALGQIVYQQKNNNASQSEWSVNATYFPRGLYFIRAISTTRTIHTQKILKS